MKKKTHVVVVVVAAFFDSRDDDDVELSGRYYYHNNKILTVSLGINITTSYTLSITNKNGDDYDDGEDKFLGKILYWTLNWKAKTGNVARNESDRDGDMRCLGRAHGKIFHTNAHTHTLAPSNELVCRNRNYYKLQLIIIGRHRGGCESAANQPPPIVVQL